MERNKFNDMRDMTNSHYGFEKFNRNVELNASMSIASQAPDRLTKANETLNGGTTNNGND